MGLKVCVGGGGGERGHKHTIAPLSKSVCVCVGGGAHASLPPPPLPTPVIHTYIPTYIHTYTHIYRHTHTHTHTHTYIIGLLNILFRDVSVIEWLAWLTSNCARIGAIASSPSNSLKPNLCQCVYVYVCIVKPDTQTIHRCSHTSIHTYIHTYINTYIHTCTFHRITR